MAIYVPITVTTSDIEHGEKEDCHSCPIALAAHRAVANHPEIDLGHLAVRPEVIEIFSPEGYFSQRGAFSAELPDDARAFIAAFDAGEPVEPFVFVASFELCG